MRLNVGFSVPAEFGRACASQKKAAFVYYGLLCYATRYTLHATRCVLLDTDLPLRTQERERHFSLDFYRSCSWTFV